MNVNIYSLFLERIFDGVYHLGHIAPMFDDFSLIETLLIYGYFIAPFYLIVFLLMLFVYVVVNIRNKKKGIVTRSEKILKVCVIVMVVLMCLWFVFGFLTFG